MPLRAATVCVPKPSCTPRAVGTADVAAATNEVEVDEVEVVVGFVLVAVSLVEVGVVDVVDVCSLLVEVVFG